MKSKATKKSSYTMRAYPAHIIGAYSCLADVYI